MQALFRPALNSARYAYKAPESTVDYLIVGGGVVGLAIARALSRVPDKSTVLLERHARAGEETSSRNSEVIHAGIYYPPNSHKMRLCIRGRELLYERCKSFNIPFRRTGKLVVATDKQRPYIESLHAKTQSIGWPSSFAAPPNRPAVPTQLLSGAEVHQMEPNLSEEITGALWSPETGIVDSHALMESLEQEIVESGGDLVYATRVVRVDPDKHGWVVQMVTDEAEQGDVILAKTLMNATGLSAPLIVNAIVPEEKRIPLFYARGSYAKYSGPGIAGISHLIYPCPETNHSLGTHLTFDLQGNVRFGPDLQWISPGEGQGPDFWRDHLVADESRLEEMHQAITRYLPGVTVQGLQPDYVGIRPKLCGPEGGFEDFVFRTDYPANYRKSKNTPLISLLGIESPGLTSSLAIAEHVVEDMLGLRLDRQ